MSSTPLTQAQRSLIDKGPNYAIALRHPPNLEYIITIESLCTKLSQQEVEELRANVDRVLRGFKSPKFNLGKEEAWAISELKWDTGRLVLTASKGVAMVVMDRQD